MVIRGETPAAVRPLSSVPLWSHFAKSREESCRHTSVGCTLSRLVAKVAGLSVMEDMTGLLSLRQLGYGVRGGAEAAVHAARLLLPSQMH